MRFRMLAALLAIAGCEIGATPDDPNDTVPVVVSAGSFVDKVMVGYQGWFAAEGDGSPLDGWYHWGRNGRPTAGTVTFELYPDVRDYPAADVHVAGFAALGNGEPARLFGSWSDGVIETHFRWMAEHGLDGAALQRFVVALYDPRHKQQRDQVTEKVRAAAERHGRVFYIAYDISGARPETWTDDIRRDFTETLSGSLDVFASEQYVHQDGRPVVLVWGLGFPDRPGEGAESAELVRWLKARGAYVVVGVPLGWRDGSGTKPGFADAFAAADMIQPWAVGSVSADADVDAHFAGVVAADAQLTRSRGQAYQRVIFPGFAWSNWNGGARNMIPRRAGRLFWRQAYQAARTQTSVMIAMFDEYDEGTAIAEAAEDASQIPSDQYFLTLDADGTRLSSDFYLRLAGAATRMLHGQAPVQTDVPIPAFPDGGGGPPPPTGVPAQSALADTVVRSFDPADAQLAVDRLYRAILGRAADPSGAATYAPMIASGHLPAVVSALVTSGEFDARRAALTATSWTDAIYVELLGRAADPSGAASTAAAIGAGAGGQRIVDIVLSPEYDARE